MGSTQSDTSPQNSQHPKRPSKASRFKSFSHQQDNNKIQITPSIVQEIKANIAKLIKQTETHNKSMTYLTQVIECKLNEDAIRQILVSLTMKQGLNHFQVDFSNSTRNQNDSLIQNVVQQTLIDLLLPSFFENFAFKQQIYYSSVSNDSKKNSIEMLKKDIQNFKDLSYQLFTIIFRKINLYTKSQFIQYVILQTLFKPESVDDYCARKKLKEFIFQYYKIYENYYFSNEQMLKSYTSKLNIMETQNILTFKNYLISINFHQKCKRKIKKLFQIDIDTKFDIISEYIFLIIDQFNNKIYDIVKNIFSEGADSRQLLNMNFITLFNNQGFYTFCQFIIDNMENILVPEQKHLITTLNISFEQIIQYIYEQYDTKLNIQTQIYTGEQSSFQSDISTRQQSIALLCQNLNSPKHQITMNY